MHNPFESIDERLANIEKLLLEIKQSYQNIVPQVDPDEILTVQGAAEFLNLAVSTIYSLSWKGEIPAMKRSKRLYFLKVDLVNYLKKGRSKTPEEIRQATDDWLAGRKIRKSNKR